MRKLHYIMHISVDGFLADSTGSLQFVKMDDEIGDWVHSVISGCDTAVYGRNTFDIMEAFWPTAEKMPQAATSTHLMDHARWVNAAQKIVFSKSLKSTTWANTRIVSEDPVPSLK